MGAGAAVAAKRLRYQRPAVRGPRARIIEVADQYLQFLRERHLQVAYKEGAQGTRYLAHQPTEVDILVTVAEEFTDGLFHFISGPLFGVHQRTRHLTWMATNMAHRAIQADQVVPCKKPPLSPAPKIQHSTS